MCALKVKDNKFTFELDKNGNIVREPAPLAQAKWNFYVYGRQDAFEQPLITNRNGNIRSYIYGQTVGSLCYKYYLEANKTLSNLSQIKLHLQNSLARDYAQGIINEIPTINILQNKKQYLTIKCKDGETELELY